MRLPGQGAGILAQRRRAARPVARSSLRCPRGYWSTDDPSGLSSWPARDCPRVANYSWCRVAVHSPRDASLGTARRRRPAEVELARTRVSRACHRQETRHPQGVKGRNHQGQPRRAKWEKISLGLLTQDKHHRSIAFHRLCGKGVAFILKSMDFRKQVGPCGQRRRPQYSSALPLPENPRQVNVMVHITYL